MRVTSFWTGSACRKNFLSCDIWFAPILLSVFAPPTQVPWKASTKRPQIWQRSCWGCSSCCQATKAASVPKKPPSNISFSCLLDNRDAAEDLRERLQCELMAKQLASWPTSLITSHLHQSLKSTTGRVQQRARNGSPSPDSSFKTPSLTWTSILRWIRSDRSLHWCWIAVRGPGLSGRGRSFAAQSIKTIYTPKNGRQQRRSKDRNLCEHYSKRQKSWNHRTISQRSS